MISKQVQVAALAALASAFVAQAAVPLYGQCGGLNYTGETTCVSGATCVYSNDWYSQCLASSNAPSTTSTKTSTKTTSTKTSSTSIKTSTSTKASSTSTKASSTSIKSSTTSIKSSTTSNGPVVPAPSGLFGYGAGTTGGGNATPVTITSCTQLATLGATETAAVFHLSTTLSGCGVIDLKSNKSLIGVGSSAGFTGGGIRIRRSTNVIIRNLAFKLAQEGDDLLALDNATQVWVDHCDFSNAGTVGDKDYYDGMLDITHASDFITVSWSKFHDHWKGSLIGHSDNNASEDTGKLHITYAFNSWTNVGSRLPSVRFGTVHVLNSYYSGNAISGINSRMGAKVLVEGNHFTDTPLAIVTDLDSDLEGYATSLNNIFVNSPTRITQTGHTTPPYSYSPIAAANVPSTVASGAGVGKI